MRGVITRVYLASLHIVWAITTPFGAIWWVFTGKLLHEGFTNYIEKLHKNKNI